MAFIFINCLNFNQSKIYCELRVNFSIAKCIQSNLKKKNKKKEEFFQPKPEKFFSCLNFII